VEEPVDLKLQPDLVLMELQNKVMLEVITLQMQIMVLVGVEEQEV
jgi:hypothetical protein